VDWFGWTWAANRAGKCTRAQELGSVLICRANRTQKLAFFLLRLITVPIRLCVVLLQSLTPLGEKPGIPGIPKSVIITRTLWDRSLDARKQALRSPHGAFVVFDPEGNLNHQLNFGPEGNLKQLTFGPGGGLNQPSFRFLVVTSAAEKLKVLHLTAATFDVVNIRSRLTAVPATTTIASNHGAPNNGRDMTLSLRVATGYNHAKPVFNRLSNIWPFYSSITDATTDVAHRLRYLCTFFGTKKLGLVGHDHGLVTIQARK